ncbi:MAG: hypothetical protein HFI70_16830 [Lachnospiraceae bacterium]|nr:hypothetical protein [Lachnospiraceae bacterium]
MRLIDADELRNKLSIICPLYATDEYDYCTKDVLEKVDDLIQKQPTAYDVDKVLERLEAEAERWKESGEEYEDQKELGVSEGFKKAIEIVKSGGIE